MKEASTLLVASAGGHLQQLMSLLEVLDVKHDARWVTYDVEQARSLPSLQPFTPAHHPTTKSLPNAVRNYRLARRVFAEHDIDRVISTGAAVAVPFMVRARQLGIPCHYIESATRVTGPSMSGRMLQRVPGVRLYRQLGGWGEPRWQQGPCVLEGYKASFTDDAAATPLHRVVVSLGTHHYAFDSLIDRLAGIFCGMTPMPEVLWQLGCTTASTDLPGEVVGQLASDRLKSAIAHADVVVGHAGVGLTLTALAAGNVPVLVPRRQARLEHTDDHQGQLAAELHERGLAVVAEVGDLTVEHLEQAAGLAAVRTEPPRFVLVD